MYTEYPKGYIDYIRSICLNTLARVHKCIAYLQDILNGTADSAVVYIHELYITHYKT